MAHDLDVDFGCFDPERYIEVRAAMIEAGFTPYRNHGTPEHGYEQRFQFKDVRVDIFYFYEGTFRDGKPVEDPELCWQGSWDKDKLLVSEFPRDIVSETVPFEFQGITVPVPCEYEAMLVARYGDWLTPVLKWDWRRDPKCLVKKHKAALADTTFLIKTFLRPQLALKAVRSIRSTYLNTPVLVVDDGNASEGFENSLNALGAKLLRLPYDSGLSAGRNAGMREIDTAYVVVMDDDMIVSGRTRVQDLLKLLENADVACGTMRQHNKIIRWEGTYDFPEDGGLRLVPFDGEFSDLDGIRYCEVEFALNVFASRTEFLKAHPWDEELKLSEHTSWFLSLRDAKAKVVFTPDCIFDHRPVKDPKYRQMRRRPEFRLRFFAKHGFKYHVGYNGHKDVWTARDQIALEKLRLPKGSG